MVLNGLSGHGSCAVLIALGILAAPLGAIAGDAPAEKMPARENFDAEMRRLEADHARRVAASRKLYLASLTDSLSAAVKADRLDEARRLAEEIRSTLADPPAPAPAGSRGDQPAPKAILLGPSPAPVAGPWAAAKFNSPRHV